MKTGPILAIGEAMVELSPAGSSDAWRLGIAGDTLNTAWYLRGLLPADWPVGYLSRVGTGAFSQRMLDFLDQSGIETQHVSRDPIREIGLYAITLKDGERSFSYWRDTSAARGLADDAQRLHDAFADASLLYLSGITLAILPQTARDHLLTALDVARAKGAQVVFDPNLRPRLWPDTATMCASIGQMAAHADLLLPSFDDEATHFGDTNPQATLARYLALGAGHVVVKNGGGPMYFAGAQGVGEVTDLVPEKPVDTTAAGDSFNAGYLAAALQGAGCEAAIRAGHALSRQVIRHPGALVPEAISASQTTAAK
ncbi:MULTISPECIES: sugar kinase [unclassified Yoonia]|uniref:sugar kinase n=1 Tax=unclassified Yoonia TaxID=2629118 RepID=UPI002AFE6DAC|nr:MULTISPECIES: sugar kinase [unclassified Yoonia]